MNDLSSHHSEELLGKEQDAPLPCETPCPKCGSMDIHRHYRMPGEEYRSPLDRHQVHTSEFTEEQWFTGKCIKECITNRCRTCHYRWDLPPLPPA